ncbi:MAG: hypothetical protein FJ387_10145 [Verrucomicrobia bacterium]|nr:hypothetical protein [Verrucomicrobiota bacterium]
MRVLRVVLFFVLGLVVLVAAALVPAYLRAVDAEVISRAGVGGATLATEATQQLSLERLGLARMLAKAAHAVDAPRGQELANQAEAFARLNPDLNWLGGADPVLQQIIGTSAGVPATKEATVVDLVLPDAARATVLEFLQKSRRPGVQELLRNRLLPQTRVFSPVGTPSGQALDSAILLTGLLSQTDHLTLQFRDELESLAAAANRGKDSGPLEGVYLDLLSLARRLDWVQLTRLMASVNDPGTLRELVHFGLGSPENLAVIFAAVHLSGSAEPIAAYLAQHRERGLRDLAFSVGAGAGAVRELLRRRDPIHRPALRATLLQVPLAKEWLGLTVRLAYAAPLLALLLKYLLWFDAVFCLARGGSHLVRGLTTPSAPQLEVRGIDAMRQQTVALMTLVAVAALGEPFLAQKAEAGVTPPNWQFPIASLAIREQITNTIEPVMTEMTWLALAVFFLIQGGIYVLCLIKLREIKQQDVSSSLKLRLLDNEEVMFDAGLYIGLGGTVLSLVLLAIGVIKPSLMVAYASTLFGIFFVSILKIVHVRPYRRSLIIEASQSPV